MFFISLYLYLYLFCFSLHLLDCIYICFVLVCICISFLLESINLEVRWGCWSAGLNNQPCFLIRIDQVNIKYTIYAIHEISSELKDSWPVLQIICYSVSFQKNCMDPLRIMSAVHDAGFLYGYRSFLAMIRKVWKRI